MEPAEGFDAQAAGRGQSRSWRIPEKPVAIATPPSPENFRNWPRPLRPGFGRDNLMVLWRGFV